MQQFVLDVVNYFIIYLSANDLHNIKSIFHGRPFVHIRLHWIAAVAFVDIISAFSASTLLIGRLEEHPACTN